MWLLDIARLIGPKGTKILTGLAGPKIIVAAALAFGALWVYAKTQSYKVAAAQRETEVAAVKHRAVQDENRQLTEAIGRLDRAIEGLSDFQAAQRDRDDRTSEAIRAVDQAPDAGYNTELPADAVRLLREHTAR